MKYKKPAETQKIDIMLGHGPQHSAQLWNGKIKHCNHCGAEILFAQKVISGKFVAVNRNKFHPKQWEYHLPNCSVFEQKRIY